MDAILGSGLQWAQRRRKSWETWKDLTPLFAEAYEKDILENRDSQCVSYAVKMLVLRQSTSWPIVRVLNDF